MPPREFSDTPFQVLTVSVFASVTSVYLVTYNNETLSDDQASHLRSSFQIVFGRSFKEDDENYIRWHDLSINFQDTVCSFE